MNSRIALYATALAAVPLIVSPASAQPLNHPGVINTDWSSRLGGAEPTAEVELSGPVLRLMTAAAGRAARFGDLVEQVQFIKVEVYEDLDPGLPTSQLAQQKARELTSGNWQSIVRVREEEESVDIVVLPRGEEVIGALAVFVAEPGELVFVNVAGDIAAAEFGERFGQLIGPIMEGELELEDLLAVEEYEEHFEDDHDDHDDEWEHEEEDEDD